jgi:hypothetical protein
MKLLRCDLGAFCTAMLVAASLALTVPGKVNFQSKLSPVLQRSAGLISCAVAICQAARESELAAVQDNQSAIYQGFSESFSELFFESFSEPLPRSLARRSAKGS